MCNIRQGISGTRGGTRLSIFWFLEVSGCVWAHCGYRFGGAHGQRPGKSRHGDRPDCPPGPAMVTGANEPHHRPSRDRPAAARSARGGALTLTSFPSVRSPAAFALTAGAVRLVAFAVQRTRNYRLQLGGRDDDPITGFMETLALPHRIRSNKQALRWLSKIHHAAGYVVGKEILRGRLAVPDRHRSPYH